MIMQPLSTDSELKLREACAAARAADAASIEAPVEACEVPVEVSMRKPFIFNKTDFVWIGGSVLVLIVLVGVIVCYARASIVSELVPLGPMVEPALPPPEELIPVVAAPHAVAVQPSRFPSQRINPTREGQGWTSGFQWYALPEGVGGGLVKARFKGTVKHFSQIPPHAQEGDMWNVLETGNAWVYCTPAGFSHPIWIDP
jgi:hypothetical protein